MKSKHTPGPWELGEFNELLGYDCMTGGVRSGPAVLDGRDYGQRTCAEISEEGKARMMADARLIAAAPDLLAELQRLVALQCKYPTLAPSDWQKTRILIDALTTGEKS